MAHHFGADSAPRARARSRTSSPFPQPSSPPPSFGIRGLVIDPYNELDHQRPPGVSETEYVSQMLTKIKRFAQHYDAHVWFVAHPKQLQQWRGDAPNLYDISGSAHFVNKADNGVVVHRVRDEGAAEASAAAGKQVNDKVRESVFFFRLWGPRFFCASSAVRLRALAGRGRPGGGSTRKGGQPLCQPCSPLPLPPFPLAPPGASPRAQSAQQVGWHHW